jgi:hypothetical protein
LRPELWLLPHAVLLVFVHAPLLLRVRLPATVPALGTRQRARLISISLTHLLLAAAYVGVRDPCKVGACTQGRERTDVRTSCR